MLYLWGIHWGIYRTFASAPEAFDLDHIINQ